MPASSALPAAASHTANTPPPAPRERGAWLREPLLHFVALGALVFGVDHLLSRRADDPRTIVVNAAIDNEARQIFKSSRGTEPNAKELSALRQAWLDNEVLYREGLAMKLDKGDSAIRDRVIFKALSMIDANVKPQPLEDTVLRRWFEAHRDKYDQPPRFDFEEAVLGGDTSESAVRAFVDKLNKGTPGEAEAGLRVFKGRPWSNLVQSYGEPFAQALRNAPTGTWQALASRDGMRAVRLTGNTPAQSATFEMARGVVVQDWRDAAAAEQRTTAVRSLAKKYTILIEAPPR
ncbi:peptidyl-prolyl cis-trans isomerase [Aquabacterium sp.]|uniref:peptidylprolyl isomerase n=1 Tax=Aquabacterium sp. TaxID=1872578 RepID=UPI0035AFADEF